MNREERIHQGLPMVVKIAAKLGHKPGSRFHDDLISAGHETLVKSADLFDPAKSPTGEIGFLPWVGQRIRWAMMKVMTGCQKRNPTSLDAEIADEQGSSLGAILTDKAADDPAELAAVNEWKETHMRKRSVLRLSNCRELTPAPEGIGVWARKLREAAFNAVNEADVTDLMRILMDRAKAGDLGAAKLVLGYLTGGGASRTTQVVVQQGVRIEGVDEAV